jgi:hypothetical protein
MSRRCAAGVCTSARMSAAAVTRFSLQRNDAVARGVHFALHERDAVGATCSCCALFAMTLLAALAALMVLAEASWQSPARASRKRTSSAFSERMIMTAYKPSIGAEPAQAGAAHYVGAQASQRHPCSTVYFDAERGRTGYVQVQTSRAPQCRSAERSVAVSGEVSGHHREVRAHSSPWNVLRFAVAVAAVWGAGVGLAHAAVLARSLGWALWSVPGFDGDRMLLTLTMALCGVVPAILALARVDPAWQRHGKEPTCGTAALPGSPGWTQHQGMAWQQLSQSRGRWVTCAEWNERRS